MWGILINSHSNWVRVFVEERWGGNGGSTVILVVIKGVGQPRLFIQMYGYSPDRTRMASIGKRTMDNSLKIFYDEVMNTALSNPPAGVPYQSIKENFRKEPTERDSRVSKYSMEEKNSMVNDEIGKIMRNLQKTKSTSRQKQPVPIETKIDDLRSIRSSRDRLSELAEELTSQKIQFKIVESKVSEQKIPQSRQKKVQEPKSLYTNGFVQKYGYMMNQKSEPKNKYLLPKAQHLSFYTSPTVIEYGQANNTVLLNNNKKYSQRVPSKEFPQSNLSYFDQNTSKYPSNVDSPSKQLNYPVYEQELEEQLVSPKNSILSEKAFKQQISFIQPTFNKKQVARKRLKKCMLAVFYMCCQVKAIKQTINHRKSKHNPVFQGLIVNVLQHTKRAFVQLLSPVTEKIKLLTSKEAVQQNSKSYLISLKEMMQVIITSLAPLKKLMMEDKYARNVLKLLVMEREHIPDRYLTPFQLARIQMSRMFGYAVKTESTCNILVIGLVLVRVILLQILPFPIKLEPEFNRNPIWNKAVNDIKCLLYLICLELIEEEVDLGKYHHLRGNWASVPADMRYMAAQPFFLDVEEADDRQLITNNWDLTGAKVFKDKLPNNWELFKDEISEWCGEICDELRGVEYVQVQLGSKSSKRSSRRQ